MMYKQVKLEKAENGFTLKSADAVGKYRKWADRNVYLRWLVGGENGRSLFIYNFKRVKLGCAEQNHDSRKMLSCAC